MSSRPILVCTAHHSGTHTLLWLLQTSPDVPAMKSREISQSIARHYGFTLPEKRRARRCLFWDHAASVRGDLSGLDVVATNRHPVASLITAMRKGGEEFVR